MILQVSTPSILLGAIARIAKKLQVLRRRAAPKIDGPGGLCGGFKILGLGLKV